MAGPTRTADRRTGDADARPRRRLRARPPTGSGGPRARRRTVLTAAALVLVLGAFGIWALYGSAWLRVEHVSVSGTRVLTEQQVRAAARIPLASPLASLDRAAAERRVRGELRRVDTVKVVRAWPHGVGVKVTERKAELVLRKAGKYVEVDSGGVRFATVDKAPDGVPLLVMGARGTDGSGRYFGPERLRRAAAEVAAALPESVHRDTRTIRVRSYDSITLELDGGSTVLWGSPERRAAKAEALMAVRKAAKDARHFDVSAPSAPAASGS